jgi:hypothetical protein
MSEHKPVVWFGDDPQPNILFLRWPFHSWKFLFHTALLVSVIATLSAIIAPSPVCLAQRTSPPKEARSTPTIEQILNRYEEALGGREAWDKLTSRVMKATMVFSPSGQEATVVVYQQFPNKFLNVTTLPSHRKTEIGFNGEIAWSKDSVEGVRRMSGLQFEMTKHMADFNEVFRLREAFPHMEFLGKRGTNGRTTYMVQTTTADGKTGTMYFDAESGLRVRVTSTGANGQTYDDYIEEYRELSDVGVKYPCHRREVWPTYTVTVRCTEILHNVAIDGSLFLPPSFEYKVQH